MLPGMQQEEPTGAQQRRLFQDHNAVACRSLRRLGQRPSAWTEDGELEITAVLSLLNTG